MKSKRIGKKKMLHLKKQTKLEITYFELLQRQVAKHILNQIMKDKTSIRSMGKKLFMSYSHVQKIINGESNVTLAVLARIAALTNKEPSINFKINKK